MCVYSHIRIFYFHIQISPSWGFKWQKVKTAVSFLYAYTLLSHVLSTFLCSYTRQRAVLLRKLFKWIIITIKCYGMVWYIPARAQYWKRENFPRFFLLLFVYIIFRVCTFTCINWSFECDYKVRTKCSSC